MPRARRAPLLAIAMIALPLGLGSPAPAGSNGGSTAEILWDTFGVPHVFADDQERLFHAFGCAQLQSHGDLLLRLYGRARGRAAEYWGEKYLDEDRWVWTNDVPARAERWYAKQAPEFRRALDAFASGVNSCAATYASGLANDVKVVLPVSAIDVLAHVQRVLHFTFATNARQVVQAAGIRKAGGRQDATEVAASNAWAIAPRLSANRHAMLLANPHLAWSDQFLLHEAHLVTPGVNSYGATLVGFPVLGIAFNDHLGWTLTVNRLDAADLYQLSAADGGYMFDGRVRAFEVETKTIRVRLPDGSSREQPLTVKRSIQGPIVAEGPAGPIALRVAGLEEPGALQEWWDMGRARNVREFEAALARLQIPMFTVQYADADGHILHVFNGRVPRRGPGDYDWARVVPGDRSSTIWTDTLRYQELPRVIDAGSGWLQSTNDPPWSATFPQVLDRHRFPSYLAPELMSLRTRRSIRMLMESPPSTLEAIVASKYSTRMELADRILDELLAVARNAQDDDVRRGAAILERWDRTADAGSRGAILFQAFHRRWSSDDGDEPFATPWSAAQPLDTPRGLADPALAVAALKRAVTEVEKRHGSLDVPWGEVYRLRRGGVDLPASGGPGDLGIFQVVQYASGEAWFGDSFIAAIEFSRPVRAQVLLTYGNSSQPGSRYMGDQLGLFARKQLRPAWRTRQDVVAHLERREQLRVTR